MEELLYGQITPTQNSANNKNAYTIYKGAESARANKDCYVFDIDYYTNSSNQNVIRVNTAEKDDGVDVNLTFKKQDLSSKGVSGVNITLSKLSNVSSISKTSLESAGTTGNFGTITVTPTENNGTFKIRVTETEPSAYMGIGYVDLTVKYNTSTGAVTSITENNENVTSSGSTVTIKNRPAVQINFSKQNFSGKVLPGAKITVENVDNAGTLNGNEKATMTLGTGTLIVKPTDPTKGTFEIKIKETTNPFGHMGIEEEVTLTVSYDAKTGEVKSITSSNETYVPSISGNGTLVVKNKPIVNLTINKTDKETGLPISGAKFDVKIENVASVKMSGYSGNNGVINSNNGTIPLPDVLAGTIKFEEIQGNGSAQDIKITLTETEAPTDYVIENPTTIIYIKQDYSQYKVNSGDWKSTSAGIAVPINITNKPAITLSGKVWEDGQIGEKVVSGPNGVRDEYYKYEKVENGKGNYTAEENKEKDEVIFKYVGTGNGNYIRVDTIREGFIDEVLVELYNADANGNKIGNKVADTTTKNGGEYEFKDIPKTANGYIVVFKYDGINYKATLQNAGNDEFDSDVAEKNRNTINANIKTISKGLANGTVPLSYKEDEPILNVNMDGTNPANANKADFQVEAHTDAYTTTTPNIDCGLVKKEFDLAIGTDVKEATLKINEKETTYDYAKIMNGDLEDITLDKILNNNSSSTPDDKVKYNLYLYSSDYNYRITDYNTGIKNQVDDNSYNYTSDSTLKELEAYVTYSVILKNQTTKNATVEEFVYYYDEVYQPVVKNGDGIYRNMVEGDTIDGYRVDKIEGNKITFISAGNNELSEPNYRKEVNLIFKLDVNSEVYKNLIKTSREAKNVAEITSYSTEEGGLIDKDSAPGNADVTFTAGTPTVPEGKYEDDTDEAKVINISVKEEQKRIIKGTVFDDKDKKGIKEDDDTVVNDVIVQLIEIKEISGQYFEYIWQETRSGNNQVITTARNGYNQKNYTNSVQAESGEYEFKDFIPGNYIIRFIYGDGRIFDTASEEYKNIAEYNGQDYKSTTDKKYKEEWYNTAGYTADQNGNYPSVARDNEARRLEVMAYSTIIDKDIGEALAEKTTLDKTWMAAETSRINVPVDADNKVTNADDTTASYDYVKDNTKVSFENMNFGLALRPNTKLVLEKHITSLKITPSGTGVQPIVDARADITQILNSTDGTATTTGITTGLATIISERGERGFWKVETDIEELAQGAQLEVEYTYVIRNEGEKDYLSSELVDAYKTDTIQYEKYLLDIVKPEEGNLKNLTKGNTHIYGNYLGQVYYRGLNEDGTVPSTDAEVPSRVEELEEALNNQLKYDDEIAGDHFEKKNPEAVSRNVYDTDGNLVDNEGNGTKNIETVVNAKETGFLIKGGEDFSKTLRLTTVLSSVTGEQAHYPSYIAEITKYSNAAGRRNMEAEPADLSYVHSDDAGITVQGWIYTNGEGHYQSADTFEDIPAEYKNTAAKVNEVDEFWGETIIISKPTGEDKLTTLQIALITISSVAVIGAGIVLIKKFVLKK